MFTVMFDPSSAKRDLLLYFFPKDPTRPLDLFKKASFRINSSVDILLMYVRFTGLGFLLDC